MNIQYYMRIFNDSMPHFFPTLDITLEYFEKREGGLVALQHFVRYLAEVHVGETVAVHFRLLGRSPKRLHFMQFMVNETTGKLACTLEVLNSHFDLERRRTSPYPERIMARIESLLAQHEKLGWEAPVCGAIRP